MRIKIIEEDFNKAGRYTSPSECLLATALQRVYGNRASMGVFDFSVNGQTYNIPYSQMKKIYKAYDLERSQPLKIVDKTPFTVYAEKA